MSSLYPNLQSLQLGIDLGADELHRPSAQLPRRLHTAYELVLQQQEEGRPKSPDWQSSGLESSRPRPQRDARIPHGNDAPMIMRQGHRFKQSISTKKHPAATCLVEGIELLKRYGVDWIETFRPHSGFVDGSPGKIMDEDCVSDSSNSFCAIVGPLDFDHVFGVGAERVLHSFAVLIGPDLGQPRQVEHRVRLILGDNTGIPGTAAKPRSPPAPG